MNFKRRLNRLSAQLRRFIAPPVLSRALKWKNPFLAAVALSILAVPMNRRNRRSVLILYKDVSLQDAGAMAHWFEKTQVRGLRIGILKVLLKGLFKEEVADSFSRATRYDETDLGSAKQEYFLFCCNLLGWLKRLMPLDAVLSCNFDYGYQHEFIRACNHLGIPFVTVLKEWMNVPARVPEFAAYLDRCLFHGTVHSPWILTYNDYIAQGLKQANYTGSMPIRIETVGMPRADFLRRSFALPKKPCLVVFSFDPVFSFRYFREMFDADEAKGEAFRSALSERARAQYRSIVEFARRRPKTKVVIKGKNSLEQALRYLEDGPKALPSNLHATNSGRAMDLIASANAVVGLNSITLAEAIMAGRAVLTPDYRDLIPGAPCDFFADFSGLVSHFITADDLERGFDAVRDALPSPESKRFLKEFLDIDSLPNCAKLESRLHQIFSIAV